MTCNCLAGHHCLHNSLIYSLDAIFVSMAIYKLDDITKHRIYLDIYINNHCIPLVT